MNHPCDTDPAGADWWQRQQQLEHELWLADPAAQALYQQWLDTLPTGHDMPRLHEMLESKYLKKEDVDPAVLWTITGVERVNVAQDGQPAEFKWIMRFEEHEKGLVLNSTNLQLIAQALNSDDSDDWIGQKIVLFNDPNVSFQGKLTGGIRVRAQRKSKTVAAMKAQAPADEFEDDRPPF